MWTRAIVLLVAAVFVYQQVFGATYIAEIMIESNVTLQDQNIQSVLTNATFTTPGSNQVVITQNELIAECLLVGASTNCSCGQGYTWTNDICDYANCCRDSYCAANVSYFIPLCIPKAEVIINGSITLNSGIWTTAQSNAVINHFMLMNGYEGLNITVRTPTIADFEADVMVKFETARFQNLLNTLEIVLNATILADTLGMVYMDSPTTAVCYQSNPSLKCMYDEVMASSFWQVNRKNELFMLNNGTVSVITNCATDTLLSCTTVTLNQVTNNWAGTFQCGFQTGSVRHTARSTLLVAMLPDTITMYITPFIVDCSHKDVPTVVVTVSAIIQKIAENLTVTWTRNVNTIPTIPPTTNSSSFIQYNNMVTISCPSKAPTVRVINNVTIAFMNRKNQIKNATVAIPVIYVGDLFCPEEVIADEIWPNTPNGITIVNNTCPAGRVGYKTRACVDYKWQSVLSYCVNIELKKVCRAAQNFHQGLGATQSVAENIFSGLNNNTVLSNDPFADISASLNVINVMATATQLIQVNEKVFPNLIEAASNMLNLSWGAVNTSVEQSMSTNYLKSMETLVKNIKVINSTGKDCNNIDLKICQPQKEACNNTVFGSNVNLNLSSGIIKAMGMKNLATKLKNNFPNSQPTSLIISATVSDTANLNVNISMDFTLQQAGFTPLCVFWNTTTDQWSQDGCQVVISGNHTTCQCSHLTSFSALMSKNSTPNPMLDIITYVGLGMSICSLIVLLTIEALVWSAVVKSNLSHFRHTSLVNISVCLLLADICFLATSFGSPDPWCLMFTIFKHFFFLGMFHWMLCLSVMLVHQLIFVFSPLRKRVFMFLSSIVGYIFPAIIVGTTYVYCKYTGSPYYKTDTCWLVYIGLLKGSMYAFLLPVGIIVLTNLFSMVVVILTLLKTSVPDDGKSDKDAAKSVLKVILFLTPVFGGTWILGFFMLMGNGQSIVNTIITYAFTILNSFQGFFILVTACFSEQKVREELIKIILAKVPSKQNDSTKRLTTTTK